MFKNLYNWLFNRALRLTHASTVKIAKMTGQSVETIQHLNDAGASIAASAADAAAQKNLPKL